MAIHVASNFSNLKGEDSNTIFVKKNIGNKIEGLVTQQDRHRVYIQESAFANYKIGSLTAFGFDSNTNNKIENVLAHEFGHLFDDAYVTDTNSDLYKKVMEIYNKKDGDYTDEEKQIICDFHNSNRYSDSPEFLDAILKDYKQMDTAAVSQAGLGGLVMELQELGK